MRLAIVGTRNCQIDVTDEIMRRIPEDTTEIISGGAAGIDTFAEFAAQRGKIPFRKFLPDYEKFGKRAPIMRNEQIVRHADQVLAFWDCASRGTANAIALCIARGVPVEIVDLSGLRNK